VLKSVSEQEIKTIRFDLFFNRAEQEQVDLQLPQTEAYTDTISIPVPVEEKIKFKEKKVTSIGSNKGGPVAFKKRKLASGARNVRRRGDDDDD
jgi:hypothetical protein